MIKQTFILVLVLLSFCSRGFTQSFSGQFIELTKDANIIKLPEIDYGTIYIESETDKIQYNESGSEIPYESMVTKNGQFTLDISKLPGDFLTVYFSCGDYAHIVLKDIPRKSLIEFIRVLPAIRNVWKPTCGNDCLTVDKKRTYKKKSFIVDNGTKQIVFKRNKRVLDKTMKIPIPFMDTWPLDTIYWYEYKYN